MKLINQEWHWEQKPTNALEIIEKAARTCYQSEMKKDKSMYNFILALIHSKHYSVLEHVSASVRIITNRGVSHELVRHRLASYSMESTRYCNYGGSDIEFIRPVWWVEDEVYQPEQFCFEKACQDSEKAYNYLLSAGWSPQQAREVLPNALKTELVMTANLREWRHIFQLRTSKKAHPQMRSLMRWMLDEFKQEIPIIFDDIGE